MYADGDHARLRQSIACMPPPGKAARRLQNSSAECGSVLLTTLFVSLCTSVIVMTMSELAASAARTMNLYSSSRQAYWFCQGTARVLLDQLGRGEAVAPSASYQVDDATVDVQIAFGKIDTVRVTVQLPGARNTLQFDYDPAAKQVRAWQDNHP